MNIIYYIVIALILTRTPYVGKYFKIFNTLVHEIGHVIMSMLTKGKVYHVHLNSDASGLAMTGNRGRISGILVSIAGYPFASLVALFMLYLKEEGHYNYLLIGVTVVLVVSVILWVRNAFGVMWLLLAASISFLFIYYGTDAFVEVYLNILIAVMLVESITTTIELVILTWLDKNNAGDATNLKNYTGIPAIVWSVMFSVVSIYLTYKAVLIIY